MSSMPSLRAASIIASRSGMMLRDSRCPARLVVIA